MTRRWAVVLAAVLTTAACTADDPPPPATMTISGAALADEPVRMSIRGLPAGAATTLTATVTDAAGARWSGRTERAAGADGTLTVGGTDAVRLLGALTPAAGAAETFVPPGSGSYDITLTAAVDGRTVATGTARRLAPADAGVTSTPLRPAHGGVYGTLYRPRDTSGRRAAVLLFGGSEGGLEPNVQAVAALLAARGFPTLAVAYFAAPGLPATLTRVPLEYFATALRTLRARPGVDPDRLYVWGASRGGEAALLLGATFPELVHGVVALVPSSYVQGAVNPERRAASAWTLHGRELPYAGYDKWNAPAASVDPRAVIPVERIRGPVLLSCGGLDLLWASCLFVDDVTQRLAARRFRYPVVALRYPDVGHFAGDLVPGTVLTPELLTDYGGTVPATLASGTDAFAKTVALLRD